MENKSANQLPASLGRLSLSPTIAFFESKTEGQRRAWLSDPETMPAKECACRTCPHARWRAIERTLVCYCKDVHQISWTPGIKASEGDITTTICDGALLAAMEEEAKEMGAAPAPEVFAAAVPAAPAR